MMVLLRKMKIKQDQNNYGNNEFVGVVSFVVDDIL